MYKAAKLRSGMVMEGSDVVGATGGIVEVIGKATKVASSMGTSGAEVGDAGVGGIVFVGSLPCSVCEGTGGVTMGGAEWPAN